MCDNWREQFFDNFECLGEVEYGNIGDISISGRLKDVSELTQNGKLLYWASAPPNYLSSFTGSGLPFANPSQAFENTPNKGVVNISNGTFKFRMYYPNAYYTKLGTTYMPPQIMFKICPNGTQFNTKVHILKLDEGIPYRMLTFPKNYNLMFYNGIDNLPLRGQETILRDSSYPSQNKMASNHWGLKPPL